MTGVSVEVERIPIGVAGFSVIEGGVPLGGAAGLNGDACGAPVGVTGLKGDACDGVAGFVGGDCVAAVGVAGFIGDD